jgi:hypothetical protein
LRQLARSAGERASSTHGWQRNPDTGKARQDGAGDARHIRQGGATKAAR